MASLQREFDSVDVQELVDSIPALIHTARPDGYLDYFNKPWLEYLGVTLDKVTGWNWTAVVHPEDLEGILPKWRALVAGGLQCSEGASFVISLSPTSQRRPEVRPTASVATVAGYEYFRRHRRARSAKCFSWIVVRGLLPMMG